MEAISIDQIELLDKFINFEQENNLFNFINEYNVSEWDVVRERVFDSILIKQHVTYASTPTYNDLCKKYFGYGRFLLNTIKSKFVIKFKSFDYVVFMGSRNLLNGKNIDFTLNNIIDSFGEASFYKIESRIDKLYNNNYDNVYITFGLLLRKKFADKLARKCCIDERLIKKFSCDFDYDFTKLYQLIVSCLREFYIEYEYYRRLLRKLNPKTVIVNQNGLQKGLFCAAKSLGIKVAEVQHGTSAGNIAYVYPFGIRNLVTLPNYIFTLSHFFHEQLKDYPLEKIVCGNNNFYKNPLDFCKDDTNHKPVIMVLYSDYHAFFIDIVKQIPSSITVYLKLHPSATYNPDEVRGIFKDLSHVNVIYDEMNAGELLKCCDYVLLTQSTFGYEALQAGKQLIIYKFQDYRVMQDVLNLPDVHLAEHVEDIIAVLDNHKNKHTNLNNVEIFKQYDAKEIRNYI